MNVVRGANMSGASLAVECDREPRSLPSGRRGADVVSRVQSGSYKRLPKVARRLPSLI